MFNPETETYQVTAGNGVANPISVEPTPYNEGKPYDTVQDAICLLDFLRCELPDLTMRALTDLLVSLDARYTDTTTARINSDRFTGHNAEANIANARGYLDPTAARISADKFTGHNAEINMANARDYLGSKFQSRPDTWVFRDSNPPESPQEDA